MLDVDKLKNEIADGINNKSKYPELSTGDCERIGAHLNSAASCPINLGFARGKKIN